jgi:CheY-like chemotaxis protein
MNMTGEAGQARAPIDVSVVKEQDENMLGIKSKDLIRVLLIDDKPEFTGPLKKQLEQWGYSVDLAADPVEGNDFLARKNYQIILVDMKFPEPFISGEKFLLQNKEAAQKATTIVLTAYPGNIGDKDALEAMNVTIIVKGDHISELKQITTKTLGEMAQQVGQAVANIVTGQSPDAAEVLPVISESNERLKRILIRWLKAMGEPGKKSIFYKGNVYSPEDIIDHIEAGTDVGKAHVNMMFNLFEDFFEEGKDGLAQ